MIDLLKRIFHIHRWEYTEAVYGNDLMERLGIPQQKARRECKSCGKIQYQDIHCLGLNPPIYIKKWRDL